MKSRIGLKLLTPLLVAMLAGGCSDGGSDDVVVGGGGNGGGGGNINPPGTNKSFTFPDFPNNGRLTLVANFQPPGETSSSARVTAAVQQGPFNNLARTTLGKVDADPAKGSYAGQVPCGTADAVGLTILMGEGSRVMGISPRADLSSRAENGASAGVNAKSDINAQATALTPQIRPRFQELPEGAEEQFFLITAFTTVDAKKVLEPNETVHCTIFAELDEQGDPCVSREKALTIAQAFDSDNPNRPGSGIYDQVRAAFGSEWNENPVGGNDGDTKVVIFFFRPETLGTGLYGYTSPIDSSPTPNDLSNKGEIVYINSGNDTTQTLSTLAHEFQHLINQNEKVIRQGTFPEGAVDENVSINEGLSQLSEEICGFDFDHDNTLLVDVCNDYLSRPEEHEFFDFFAAGLGYGQGYLFFKYVREQYGDQVIRDIVTSSEVGKTNLDAELPNGFDETFRRWTVANWATNLGGSVPAIYRYPSGFETDGNYQAGQLVGPHFSPLDEGNNQTDALGAWSVQYLSFAGGNGDDLSINVTTAPGSPIGVVYEALDGAFTSFDE